jgi:hypothetical protein
MHNNIFIVNVRVRKASDIGGFNVPSRSAPTD